MDNNFSGDLTAGIPWRVLGVYIRGGKGPALLELDHVVFSWLCDVYRHHFSVYMHQCVY